MARGRSRAGRVLSMTGHGRGDARGKAGSVEVEVSSVNRRQLDVRVNVPREMSMLEPMIYDLIGDRVSRGSVTVLVRYAPSVQRGAITINEDLAARHLRELRKIGGKLGLRDDISLRTLLTLPDVIRHGGQSSDTELRELVKQALASALNGMIAMREREGTALAADIQKRFEGLAGKVVRVKAKAGSVSKRYRDSLLARMKKAGAELEAGSPQVVRELALFADKSDITEECVRLESHFSQAGEIFSRGGSIGRTLDFLCQEIFREINTIGSKANDSAISRIVVDFKAELEAIREQVQNVE